MSEIVLQDILKIFPFMEVKGLWNRKKKQAALEQQKTMPYVTNEGVIVLQHINVTIHAGEFAILLGPSGCGKTTLLRIIAGLEAPTLGDVFFDGKPVNKLPPEERDVAMVFQNYSLYPHLTAFDNIAFPLRTLHMPRHELEAAVNEMAGLLGIEDCLNRLPAELSGGQLQRIAIARALVRKPKLFLMDEPFSNLDAPLRAELRRLVKKIHKELGTTFIYVTHDHTEALSLGERVFVMRDGMIVQEGTPAQVYNRPINTYVAANVGTPPMNLFENVTVSNGTVRICGADFPAPVKSGTVTVGIRPVNILLGAGNVHAVVSYAEPMGSETLVHLRAGDDSFTAVLDAQETGSLMRGQAMTLSFPVEKLHFFTQSGERI